MTYISPGEGGHGAAVGERKGGDRHCLSHGLPLYPDSDLSKSDTDRRRNEGESEPANVLRLGPRSEHLQGLPQSAWPVRRQLYASVHAAPSRFR